MNVLARLRALLSAIWGRKYSPPQIAAAAGPGREFRRPSPGAVLPFLALALLLTGCAPSPLQQARWAEAQRLEEERLTLALTRRCDPEAGHLLEQQRLGWPNGSGGAAELERRRAVPSFQSCMALGWENLAQRERLERLEQRLERRQWRRWHRYSLFDDYFYDPFW